jgi:muramoyltetrapeptide carboxypeptidase
MVAFHGPTVTTLGNGSPSTRDHFQLALTQPVPLTIAAEPNQVIRSGRAAGRFLCGNLTLFSHLTGTPFQPDFNDCILLVEDQGEAPYRLDRMLTQMLMAGCFRGLPDWPWARLSAADPPKRSTISLPIGWAG